jgi:hypothetical protein
VFSPTQEAKVPPATATRRITTASCPQITRTMRSRAA